MKLTSSAMLHAELSFSRQLVLVRCETETRNTSKVTVERMLVANILCNGIVLPSLCGPANYFLVTVTTTLSNEN